jgi:hypothetical protein
VLAWTQQTDGWHADGFLIELSAPRRWLLLDSDRLVQSVSIEERPLAVARTLTECKREAELLAAARRRADLRRKHTALLLLMLAALPILVGSSFPQNALVVVTFATLATRSLGVVVGTILWRWTRGGGEVFYQ